MILIDNGSSTGADNAGPNTPVVRSGDRGVITAGVEILSGEGGRRGIAKVFPFIGPAFIASVAYLDPGNYATNLEGGAKFGYQLIWVVLASNLMAMLIQSLSAKLGIATGRNLAEICRDHYPRPLVWFLWGVMELVAMATDLAEFLGAALGFHLLFGMPMWFAGLLTALATFLIMAIERFGFRPLEAVITTFVGIIACCYLVELLFSWPDWGKVGWSIIRPGFSREAPAESVLLATGILGATVMPHVIFLHSALTQGRIVARTNEQMRRLFRYELLDVMLAMGIAGLVNAAMLIVAAKTFHDRGLFHIDAIEKAYMTLEPLLGKSASVIFAVSLLASGLASSAVGTISGQIIMQGFLNRHIPVWLRRLITMAPALIVIMAGFDPTRTLIISQVVLSFGLPFAVIPLVQFSRKKAIMGVLVNKPVTTLAAAITALLIVSLNMYLLFRTVSGG
ncbi:MAG: Nramp family divalent metal transporter [Candidatus Sumerlaeota bacterium]|nr:Nramp family divalent metal transporter [Candidatus Sumerlaeota bacterium]